MGQTCATVPASSRATAATVSVSTAATVSVSSALSKARSQLLLARFTIETRGHFRDWTALMKAVTALNPAYRGANPSPAICRKAVEAFARQERNVTYQLLRAASVYRLAADGKARVYQVEIGGLLWKRIADAPWLFEAASPCQEL